MSSDSGVSARALDDDPGALLRERQVGADLRHLPRALGSLHDGCAKSAHHETARPGDQDP
jgi:hypothetical protein